MGSGMERVVVSAGELRSGDLVRLTKGGPLDRVVAVEVREADAGPVALVDVGDVVERLPARAKVQVYR